MREKNQSWPGKDPRKKFGTEGETLARAYLEERGYRWLASGYSSKWGEIDLIMEHERSIVFVEVKRRRGSDFGPPEEAITEFKKNHIVRSALLFLQSRGYEERSIRFDVVTMDPEGLRHYINAFEAGNQFYY